LPNDCNSVSINNFENRKEKKIELYPNPSSGIIHIVNKASKKIKSIKIFSVCGELQMIFYGNSSKLDLNNLSPGVYFIKITTSKNTRIFDKIIIQ